MNFRFLPACAIMFWLCISASPAAREAKLIEKEGKVMVTKLGAKPAPAVVGLGLVARDKLGTGEASRAVLQMTEKWMARIDEETDLEITASALSAKNIEALKVQLGGAFIFSRESESELKVEAPSATLGIRGTQFVIRVFPSGRMLTKVIEGEIDVHNEHGRVLLKAGESAEAERGKAPRKTASIVTRNLLQWALYYPAVLQPDELAMPEAEKRAVAESLAAYRAGDLLGALAKYPGGHRPASAGGRAYRAAVLLATGRVEKARAALRDVPAGNAARRALERMISAVLFQEEADAAEPRTAGEALAESYYQQSRSQLEKAREMARRATELAPGSGYAWTRLGELEFSFAHTKAARVALARPHHAHRSR